jgi:hypothetical protein
MYEQNFIAQSTGQPAFGPFFTGQAPLGNNVYYLAADANHVFGYYSLLNYPYIYRYDMGWEYYIDANNAAHGAYFYDFLNSAFYYTEPGVFPYIYDFNVNAWMWYEPDASNDGNYTSNPRWFLNLSTQGWTNSL